MANRKYSREDVYESYLGIKKNSGSNLTIEELESKIDDRVRRDKERGAKQMGRKKYAERIANEEIRASRPRKVAKPKVKVVKPKVERIKKEKPARQTREEYDAKRRQQKEERLKAKADARQQKKDAQMDEYFRRYQDKIRRNIEFIKNQGGEPVSEGFNRQEFERDFYGMRRAAQFNGEKWDPDEYIRHAANDATFEFTDAQAKKWREIINEKADEMNMNPSDYSIRSLKARGIRGTEFEKAINMTAEQMREEGFDSYYIAEHIASYYYGSE